MVPGELGWCRAESRGAGWVAQSRLGQLAVDTVMVPMVPGEHGWCRAESRETGWAGLVEAWTGRCPVLSVCQVNIPNINTKP
jgi:hypothetical protein